MPTAHPSIEVITIKKCAEISLFASADNWGSDEVDMRIQILASFIIEPAKNCGISDNSTIYSKRCGRDVHNARARRLHCTVGAAWGFYAT